MAFGDQDASGPAFVKASNAGNDVTTASFTPPAGALLVAFAWHDTAGGNVTNTSVVTDSQGLTWTIRATRSKQDDGVGAANSHVQISTAVVASSVAMTVTSTGTNCNDPAGLYVRVITGADTTTPMDATPVEGTTNAAVVSTTITTVTDGARCFLQVIDWNVAAAMTAGTGQTAVVSDTIGGSPDDRIYLGVTDAVTSPAGATTLSTASPSTGNTQNWIGVAVRPAAGGVTNLNAGNAATAVAANNAGLAVSTAAGNAAVAVAANAASLTVATPASNAALAVAANSATLAVSIPATHGALAVGAFDASLTVGVALDAGSAAVAIAANSASLQVGTPAGGAALAVAANAAALAVATPAGGAAVAVGAFDASLSVSGATLLSPTGAMISVGAFDATITGSEVATVPGSWQGLKSILDEIRQVYAEERTTPPTACPRCGEPLYSSHGALRCRFDGWSTADIEPL
jgi:hypothetical protein